MKTIIFIFFYILNFILSFTLVLAQQTITSQIANQVKLMKLTKTRVNSLFSEINYVRSNSKEYSLVKNLQSEKLDTLVIDSIPFILNSNLCQKAQKYSDKLAKDKYNPNYIVFKHSDLGYNESMAFNDSTGKIIRQLIKDDCSDNKGHRLHLLGVNNNDTKIGIGISYIPSLEWYAVIIITER